VTGNNPNIEITPSRGIDLPIRYVYLAGYMSGEKLEETMAWRKRIRNYFRYWDGTNKAFPYAFLDPYNGNEGKSIDQKGLTSHIPPKAIIDSDLLSVKHADIIVANLDTFGSDRPMVGTHWELAWAYLLQKPFILIVPKDKEETYKKHPFTAQASWIVTSVDELLEKKILEGFYRRMAGAIY